MEIKLENTSKWKASFTKADRDEKAFEFLIETLKSDIPDSFFDKILLDEYICDVMNTLQKENRFSKIIELYEYSEKYKEKFGEHYYLDYYCIDYYLYKCDVQGIKKHLVSFLKNPVRSIDIFTPIYEKIVYYGYRDLSIQICLDIIDKVKDAPGLIAGTEEEFTKTMVAEKMQCLYDDMKNGVPIDKGETLLYLEKYDYNLQEADIDRMKSLWAVDHPEIPDFKEYKKDAPMFEWKLMLLFMDYMACRNISFASAYDIWDLTTQCFNTRMLSREKAESFDSMFTLDAEKYDYEIYGRMDEIFSNKVTCAYAAAWGMQYLYDFLHKHRYISDKIYEEACSIIDSNKMEIIESNPNKLWKYHFLYKWGKPDGIPDEQFERMKELSKLVVYS